MLISRRSPVLALSAAVLTGALLLAGCAGEPTPEVQVADVGPGEVTETVNASATVTAKARQDVSASVGGVITSLEIEEGATVEEGDTLARLDSEQVEEALEQAEAAAAAAEQIDRVAIDGSGDETRQAVQQAVAEVRADAEPTLAEAREEAEALEDEEQREAALAAAEALETSLETTVSTLTGFGDAIAAAQDNTAESLSQTLNTLLQQFTAAERAQAQAAAQAAAEQEEELVLTAPIDGTVQFGRSGAAGDGLGGLAGDLGGLGGGLGGLADGLGGDLPDLDGLGGLDGLEGGGEDLAGGTVAVGAPVSPGQPVFTIYDLSEAYVTAPVDEVDAPAVAAGQDAEVIVDAVADEPFTGTVEHVDLEGSPSGAGGVAFDTRIRLHADAEDAEGPAAALRPGMTAQTEIVTDEVAADLVTDSRALVNRDGEQVVLRLVEGEDGARAEAIPVEVRAQGLEEIALEGGLDQGDEVLVAGYEGVGDGDAVEVAP